MTCNVIHQWKACASELPSWVSEPRECNRRRLTTYAAAPSKATAAHAAMTGTVHPGRDPDVAVPFPPDVLSALSVAPLPAV